VQNIKLGVLLCGLVGLLGCFLPMVSEGGMSVKFWDMHSVDMAQTMMVLIGYGAGLVMGVLAMKGGIQRWQAIVALVGFGFVVFKMRDGFMHLLTDGAIGAKLMWIGAVGGLVCAIIAIAKPAPAKA
jgi:hypothetical protein